MAGSMEIWEGELTVQLGLVAFHHIALNLIQFGGDAVDRLLTAISHKLPVMRHIHNLLRLLFHYLISCSDYTDLS